MEKIIGILALTTSLPVLANGFYLGGHLGITSFDARSDNISPTVHTTDSDMTYGAFVGYQYDLSRVFLALEGDIFLAGTESARVIGGTRYSTRRNQIGGLSGLVGFNVNDYVALYGRLGWANTQFELTENDTTSRSSKHGAVFGWGMRYNMMDWLSVRFDYRYVEYRTFNFVETPRKFDVNDQLITAGLQYNF